MPHDVGDPPLVSVVCITYNHAAFIERALRSFIEQETEFPFEVIVADDCSPDTAREIIDKISRERPDIIRPIFRDANIGAEENFLDACRHVRGKYVAICEGDDYFIDPQKLQMQVEFLERNSGFSGVCTHALEENVETGETVTKKVRSLTGRLSFRRLLKRNAFRNCTIMYRWIYKDPSSLKTIPRGILPGDHYLHLAHAKTGDIGVIRRVTAVYNRHPGGLWWLSIKDKDEHFRKHGLAEVRFFLAVLKNIAGRHSDWYFETVAGPRIASYLSFLLREKNFEGVKEVFALDGSQVERAWSLLVLDDPRKRQKSGKQLKLAAVGLGVFVVLAGLSLSVFS